MLRAVIADFYQRMSSDIMIGYLFTGKDVQRFVDKEVEFVAALLGGDVTYTGRSVKAAHAGLGIMGGHFARRTELLRQTLRDHNVDPDVTASWLSHTEAMRDQVTSDPVGHCGTRTA